MVDALCRLCDGRTWSFDPVFVSSGRLYHQAKMKKYYQRWIPPLLTIGLGVFLFISFFTQLLAPAGQGFNFKQFSELPVVADGRLKPMDLLARNSLLQIYERQTFNTEPWKDWNQKQRIISATEWLANVMMNPQVADTWPV